MSSSSHPMIQVLSPQLANQIAAGEVVERPASVVKELVENSLDAGATQIHVEIEQGGQKRILIRDNGRGIPKDQLVLALSRHATSKISNIDDLEHITSMGFRGEALASISSVSRLCLTSKPEAQSEAWQAVAEGREMDVKLMPAAHPDGTSIEVLDLFFNTPARRKFLRTGKTEFQHIEHIIKRLALTREDVHFVLMHNQKTVFNYRAGKALAQRIEQVCGKQMLLNSVPVNYFYEGVKLSGWCSQLGAGVATRDLQYTFVNGRMMKDKLLSHALRQVYEETLPGQMFPSYVLYLTVPPEQLDVNVHPAKHEVRFHQARKVHDLVFKAVNDAISAGLLTNESAQNSESAPKHGYIRALQDESADHQSDHAYAPNHNAEQHLPYGNDKEVSQTNRQSALTGSSKSYSGRLYVPEKPSGSQIKAAHELYQSDGYSGVGKARISENEDNLAGQTSPFMQFLRAGDYIVFSGVQSGTSPVLTVIALTTLLNEVVQQRIEKSTVAQALLMPVSCQIDSGITSEQISHTLNSFNALHFELVKVNNKIILKQVPSELRQLPWAAMFSAILSELCKAQTSEAKLAVGIANAWLKQSSIESPQIQSWINELSAQSLNHLINENGKVLALQEWMQSHAD